jgi:DNA-binding SARP family transcriptional activator
MAKLELFLLGRPQIYVDGQAVTAFNTRKDCALLAYLAVAGTPHSRATSATPFPICKK